MFEVGFTEIILILGIALLVLGPEKLPKLANQVGRWAGRARSMARQLRQQLDEEVEIIGKDDFGPAATPPAGQACNGHAFHGHAQAGAAAAPRRLTQLQRLTHPPPKSARTRRPRHERRGRRVADREHAALPPAGAARPPAARAGRDLRDRDPLPVLRERHLHLALGAAAGAAAEGRSADRDLGRRAVHDAVQAGAARGGLLRDAGDPLPGLGVHRARALSPRAALRAAAVRLERDPVLRRRRLRVLRGVPGRSSASSSTPRPWAS